MSTSPPLLSIVIVSYNVRHFLEQCLTAVFKAQGNLNLEVWVVDNASADDSVTMVKALFPQVHLLANSDNPGFAKANNQALRLAQGDFLLLLNPDTVVAEDTFALCLDYFHQHPRVGALGVKMIDGSGQFLPESRRGFPTPWVAFTKTFGLARLFPHSRRFNTYHLGFLDPTTTAEVDVLSGAFLLVRRATLVEAGLLDEQFFMYGEDIDWSYRLRQTGYTNAYLAKTTIIHYKGESTKKGSLNYVRTFYQAMMLFTRKHFQGQQAWLLLSMLQGAIYFRAGLTVLGQALRQLSWPLVDAAVLGMGLWWLKNIWAVYRYANPNYFQPVFGYFNIPLYVSIWLLAIFLSGGYDRAAAVRRVVRGVWVGAVGIAAVYGLLDLAYRSSRAIIVLGFLWGLVLLPLLRLLVRLWRDGVWQLDSTRERRLAVVGSVEQARQVLDLLQQAGLRKKIMGVITPPGVVAARGVELGQWDQLSLLCAVYRIEELVFCAQDLSYGRIINWMERLPDGVNFKIFPPNGSTIIGSSSKNEPGELYSLGSQFPLASSQGRREKRLLDLAWVFGLVLTLPLQWWWMGGTIVRQAWSVFWGRATWVGYHPAGLTTDLQLPTLRPGVFDPLGLPGEVPPAGMDLARLNYLYARHYHWWEDARILWRIWRKGRRR